VDIVISIESILSPWKNPLSPPPAAHKGEEAERVRTPKHTDYRLPHQMGGRRKDCISIVKAVEEVSSLDWNGKGRGSRKLGNFCGHA